MTFIRVTYKFIALFCMAVIAVFMMFLYSFSNDTSPNNDASPNKKQKKYRKYWLQTVATIIGLQIEVRGQPDSDQTESKQQNALWVSNHISWMDIVAVGSQGVGFLSKAEVRKWPFIGWLGDKGGTVFIQRGGKNASQIASRSIAEKIIAGDNILVFPEATTGLGDRVKPFHARIFASALDHQLLVQPIALQYLDEHGQIHPKVTWINQGFMNNMLGVLGQKKVRVVLTFLPIIDAKDYTERKQVAELAENLIRDVIVISAATKIA